jgi:hypothetical protein
MLHVRDWTDCVLVRAGPRAGWARVLRRTEAEPQPPNSCLLPAAAAVAFYAHVCSVAEKAARAPGLEQQCRVVNVPNTKARAQQQAPGGSCMWLLADHARGSYVTASVRLPHGQAAKHWASLWASMKETFGRQVWWCASCWLAMAQREPLDWNCAKDLAVAWCSTAKQQKELRSQGTKGWANFKHTHKSLCERLDARLLPPAGPPAGPRTRTAMAEGEEAAEGAGGDAGGEDKDQPAHLPGCSPHIRWHGAHVCGRPACLEASHLVVWIASRNMLHASLCRYLKAWFST